MLKRHLGRKKNPPFCFFLYLYDAVLFVGRKAKKKYIPSFQPTGVSYRNRTRTR
jgi:hypothetical protein